MFIYLRLIFGLNFSLKNFYYLRICTSLDVVDRNLIFSLFILFSLTHSRYGLILMNK